MSARQTEMEKRMILVNKTMWCDAEHIENDKGNTSDLFYLAMSTWTEMLCNIDDEMRKIKTKKIYRMLHNRMKRAELCVKFVHSLCYVPLYTVSEHFAYAYVSFLLRHSFVYAVCVSVNVRFSVSLSLSIFGLPLTLPQTLLWYNIQQLVVIRCFYCFHCALTYETNYTGSIEKNLMPVNNM